MKDITQQYRRAIKRWAKARKLFAHPRDGTTVRPNKLRHGWAAIYAAERAWEEARHVVEAHVPASGNVHARIMARLRSMSLEEGAQTLVKAGIYKSDGTLTEHYREPTAEVGANLGDDDNEDQENE